MRKRIKSAGENFSNPRSEVVHLLQDGTNGEYVRLGDRWHLLVPLADATKSEIDGWRPQFDYLQGLIECHKEMALHLRRCVTGETTELQHIIIASHVSASVFLNDAFGLSQQGSLASSQILLRPVVEILLELQYLGKFPDEAGNYYGKVAQRNRRFVGGETLTGAKGTLRFKSIGDIVESLQYASNSDQSELEQSLIEQWQSLSDVAAHTTPELLEIGQGRQLLAWDNTFGEIERATTGAIEQLFGIDQELCSLIDQEPALRRTLLNLSLYGTPFSPSDIDA